MNPPLRKLSVVVLIMFVTLMVALTYIQFFRAPSLNADGRNVRTLYAQYGTDRGNLVVGGEAITSSEPVDDAYKFQRMYANGPLYAPLTGYFSVAFNSMTELERSQNGILSGSDSSLFTQRLQQLITGAQPKGGSVSLTIDPVIQQAAADALAGQKGAIVALEPSTGKILALVTTPTYDPNTLATHDATAAQQAWEELNADPDKPLMNRATSGDLYPPGSSFKIVTVAAMEEEGITSDSVIEAPTTYTLPGTATDVTNFVGECGDGSGQTSLRTALVLSCNTPFAIAGVEMGAQKLMDKAAEFGFGQELDLGIDYTPSLFPEPSDDAALAMDAFGQRDIQTTPLQMAMVAAAVANHGTLMKPYLVDQTLSADLSVISTTAPEEFSQPMSRAIADDITSMMKDVVADRYVGARVPGVDVAGKTGTAENAEAPHAWFIGFDAGENPKIALAVFVENGGLGGDVAGPLAAQVIQAAVNR